ncbi:MAG: hypothetical protein AAF798_10595 [Bacteroidota bacterium]
MRNVFFLFAFLLIGQWAIAQSLSCEVGGKTAIVRVASITSSAVMVEVDLTKLRAKTQFNPPGAAVAAFTLTNGTCEGCQPARGAKKTTWKIKKSGSAAPVMTWTSFAGGDCNGKFITLAPAAKSTLTAGQELKPASKTFSESEILVSANKKYMLRLQREDGNLCIYRYQNGKQGSFVWCSMAQGFKPGNFIMQADGNAVVYTSGNDAKWSTKTHPYYDRKYRDAKKRPVKLVLENDGKLKLYNATGTVMWSS